MKCDKPWLLVREAAYFRGVLGALVRFDSNARHDARVRLRFGLMGDGIQPNYQVEGPGDRVVAYSGGNHQADKRAPSGRYDDKDLSEQRFTLSDVQKLLDRCLHIQSRKMDPGAGNEGP